MVFDSIALKDLPKVAGQMLNAFPTQRFYAFYGSMGAGKTTLIKEICHHLQVADIVNSPTFALVKEYKTDNGKMVFHFDFYRLKKIEEAFDIGYEEYFFSGDYCLIEWPEKIDMLLPPSYVRVEITERTDENRRIEVKLIS